MMFDGQGGVKRDAAAAVKLFKKSCEGDAKDACVYLAVAHLSGRGGEARSGRAP